MSRLAASVARIEARIVQRKAKRAEAVRRKATRADTRRKRARTGYARREATKIGNRLRAEIPRLDPATRAIYAAVPAELRLLILEQAIDARSPFVRTGPSLDDAAMWRTA